MYWQSCGDFSKIPFIIVKFINYSLKIKFLNEFVNNEIMIAIENVLNINLLNETVSRMFLDNITETYCTVLTPHYSI